MTRAEFFDRALLAYASSRDRCGYLLSSPDAARYARDLLDRRDEWRRANGYLTGEREPLDVGGAL